jgi:uncharacterized cupredoxin-like copper-binding protein
MPRTAYAVTGLAALALAVAGCGGSSKKTASTPSTPATTSTPAKTQTSPAPAPAAGAVTIGETEYKLSPSNPTAKSGAVTVTAKNDGTIIHTLEVEGNGVEQKTGNIQPGSSSSLKLHLKPGKYEIYCTISGHKQLGMKGDLVVK